MRKLAGIAAILAFDNWPALLFSRLFDRSTGLVIYRKRGNEILVDHRGGDENGTRACIVGDMYSRYLPMFDLPSPARILDLGANGGGFPLMLKIEGIELASVVSVEMNPLTFLRLQLNLATNLGPRAVAIHAAATGGPDHSEISLAPSRGDTGQSIYAQQSNADSESVAVRARTFEGLYNQFFQDGLIDICKIDIEGAEYEVLDAAPDQMLVRIRYLLIEFHEPLKTPALVARLESLGFKELHGSTFNQTGPREEVRVFQGPKT